MKLLLFMLLHVHIFLPLKKGGGEANKEVGGKKKVSQIVKVKGGNPYFIATRIKRHKSTTIPHYEDTVRKITVFNDTEDEGAYLIL